MRAELFRERARRGEVQVPRDSAQELLLFHLHLRDVRIRYLEAATASGMEGNFLAQLQQALLPERERLYQEGVEQSMRLFKKYEGSLLRLGGRMMRDADGELHRVLVPDIDGRKK